ncbi:gliding motility-associated C-terminal domain-containing protein [Flavobacteriaceae bacterium MAR_2010_188]|nr:gliding motility-associated C-terminal domain-containing protein [Flavobacteriaceae bacterium MAR_2010_188]
MRQFCLLLILSFSFLECIAQTCPILTSPIENATNVSVDASIRWESIEGVTGYLVSVGTSSGGGEIVDNQQVGSSNSIKPSTGLPENTRIYVTITLFFFNQPNIPCETQSFTTENVTIVPECTSMISPLNGANNVNVAANIRWQYANKAKSYRITVGLSPGGSEILNNFDVGNVLSYNPPSDLPADTKIYVRITPYNENGNASGCPEESFTIGPVAQLPGCTTLISPLDGAINVPLSPFVEWEAVPGATGYNVSIGKTPDENDILDGGNFSRNSTFVFNFESNNVYFIRIIPFNAAGLAIDCPQYSFSTVLGCGPFYGDDGELVTINPVLEFPEFVGICSEQPQTLSTDFVAAGYRWYKVGQFEDELISEEREITIDQVGTYLLEAYNYTYSGDIECPTLKQFEVLESDPPTIDEVEVLENELGLKITVTVKGNGQYEYALDPAGPFQSENVFLSADIDTEAVYVRDVGGCGVVEYRIQFTNNNQGFPKFFTPNGDGYNDTWQYRTKGSDDFALLVIYIFDRYGKLLKSLSPNSRGWDGEISGQPLPTSDYWYKAITTDRQIFSGHFALKR